MKRYEAENLGLLAGSMRFSFKKSSSAVAYCALTIKGGTASEPAEHSGMAHLTEHMLFKGTSKRSASSINNRLERLGGELNAYTTKEEIVIYSTTLKEDVLKAIDLIFELAFDSIYSARELDKERSVVADEISLYKDSPSDYIFDDFEQFLFEGSPLSRPILGTVSSLKGIKSDDLKIYTSTAFYPCDMSFSVVGNFDFDKIAASAEKLLDKYISTKSFSSNVNIPDVVENIFRKDVCKKNHQSNCIIGAPAYCLYDDKRLPLILLCNLLGGPSSNSILNSSLREKKGLVYTIEASYTQYAKSGVASIYFGSDKSNVDKCLALVEDELEKIRTIPLSQTALQLAKKQLLAQNTISMENGEAQALSIGKSTLCYGKYLSEEEIKQKINSIRSEDIQKAAQEIFAKEKLSYLIYR